MKIFYFGYRTVNLINGNYYYGIHKTTNLDDGYIGCGIKSQSYAKLTNRLHAAVRKYGYKNFKRKILKYFNTYQKALSWEKKFIDRKKILNKKCYNLKEGGYAGSILPRSAATRKRLSINAINRFKNSPGTFTGKTHSIELRRRWSRERKGMPSPNKGRKLNLTPERRKQISDLAKLRVGEKNANYIKFSKRQIKKIIKLYTKDRIGKISIGKIMNVSEGKITRVLRENNIKMYLMNTGTRLKRFIDFSNKKANIKKIISMYPGNSLVNIGKILHVPKYFIRKILIQNNIKIEPRGFQKNNKWACR